MNFIDCHEEKIHISGHIQDFGYLIGLDYSTMEIKFFSANIAEIFPLNQTFFGQKLQDSPDLFASILKSDIYNSIDFECMQEVDVCLEKINVNGKIYHLTIYLHEGIVFLEMEEVVESFNRRNFISKKYENIHNATTSENIWNELLKSVSDAIDYDRMMVYRFLEDGSGKVIAEKVKNKVESFLNLHYPESDIPKQARALYMKKRKRIFSNVHSTPVPIIGRTDESIDLTYSSVRAMSPVHGQYLKNTGVASSFSTSIIVDNKLWGLVTCQNIEPKHIDLVNRIRAEVFTVLAANAYTSFKSGQILADNLELDRKIEVLKNRLLQYDNIEDSLFGNVDEILEYPEADGFAVVVGDNIKTAGEVPAAEHILKIVNYARENTLKNFYTTNDFGSKLEGNLGDLKNAAGVMFGFTDEKRHELLIWFRKEIDLTVLWAGNPAKETITRVIDGEEHLTISPRKSFETYIENVRGKATPWKSKDVIAAKKVVNTILETTYTQFKKVRELNNELQNLNEELDSFSYTISHDLGTPLTVMKLNAQLMEKSYQDDPIIQKRITSILKEIQGMENMMRGVLNLSRAKSTDIKMEAIATENIIRKICNDAKLTLNPHVEIIIGNLPGILGDQVMAVQVFINIIGNAVKYSSKQSDPKVIIHGEEGNDCIIYKITDNGIGIPENAREKMFKIFNRMDNAKAFDGNGVGLSIAYRIMNRLGGEVIYTPNEDEGTTFILKFQKPASTL